MDGISAKMYSIWNGGIHVESMWNEIYSMWSPCGAHVECGGGVKTSNQGLISTIKNLEETMQDTVFISCLPALSSPWRPCITEISVLLFGWSILAG